MSIPKSLLEGGIPVDNEGRDHQVIQWVDWVRANIADDVTVMFDTDFNPWQVLGEEYLNRYEAHTKMMLRLCTSIDSKRDWDTYLKEVVEREDRRVQVVRDRYVLSVKDRLLEDIGHLLSSQRKAVNDLSATVKHRASAGISNEEEIDGMSGEETWECLQACSKRVEELENIAWILNQPDRKPCGDVGISNIKVACLYALRGTNECDLFPLDILHGADYLDIIFVPWVCS